MPIKKDSTIGDVSKMAGVSISTVSRVLNSPDRVRPDTRKRVQQAIDALSFVPASSLAAARQLQEQERRIFIYLPDIRNGSVMAIAQGIIDRLDAGGATAMIWSSNEVAEWERKGFSQLGGRRAVGAISVMGILEEGIVKYAEPGLPVVTIEHGTQLPGADSVMVDSVYGMYTLVGHLAGMGHKNIAFLCGDISKADANRKILAFRKAMQSHRLPWDVNFVVPSQWGMVGGREGIRKTLEWLPEVTAVICITDIIAIGAIHELKRMDLSCPGTISVTGFDNLPDGEHLTPRLTTLSYPAYQMGRDAADLILRRLQEPKRPYVHTLYPLELIAGETVGPPR